MRQLLAFFPILALSACGNSVPQASPTDPFTPGQQQSPADQGPSRQFTEGKDYLVLERLRVIDHTGFAQPMEAYSLLVPKGWKGTGGISWNVGTTCMAEAISNRLTVSSPDGAWALETFPQRAWDWWDDQMMLQMQVQQAQNPVSRRCNIAQPLDAAGFLQGPMAQAMGAQVVSVEPAAEITRMMQQQAQSTNRQYQQAGVPLESRPSAATGILRFPDGSAGVALCMVEMTVAWMPNYMTGGQSASYNCMATTQTALRCPAGREAEARQLLGAITASFRANPQWQQGVQQLVRNVATMERREEAKRAAMQREAMDYSTDLRQRTWEHGQASRDRIAEGWGQVLRGVETWNDPNGEAVELRAGYNEAWSRPDGTYILSNDPLFDPSVVFQEDWRRLRKAP